jgi:hypothetical protein
MVARICARYSVQRGPTRLEALADGKACRARVREPGRAYPSSRAVPSRLPDLDLPCIAS